ncbi:MAG: hypothetical protein ORN50_00985 [Crocinitomicaceae bacterium]|nr:hypothetical protein [Crocinitomicaceae bacterium]
MKSLFKKGYGLLAVVLMAVALLAPFGVVGAPAIAGGTIVVGAVAYLNNVTSVTSVGLNAEIWLPDLEEGFYADDALLSEFVDLSAFVDNDIINLAEAGIDPEVFVNSATDIPYSQRTDVPIALQLDTLDTENTLLKNAEVAELKYDKRKSIIDGHANALKMWFLTRILFNLAPSTDTVWHPKLVTTGADDGSGRKRLTFADVRRMKRAFDQARIPASGRVLALSSTHEEDLDLEDKNLFNQIMNKGAIYGFKMYSVADQDLPRYNKTTGAKVAWQAAAAVTDSTASIFWHNREAFKCRGTAEMFIREKDPELRGDVMGFQQRALGGSKRNKGNGAIYSAAV